MNSGKDIQWPEKVGSITVTLKRTAQGDGGSLSEETAVFTVGPDSISIAEDAGSDFTAPAEKLAGEDYRYKITDLAKYSSDGTEWIYSVSETVVDGFNKPAYYTINDDGVKEEQLSSEKVFFAVPGKDGGVEIVNDEIVLQIPSTGGPGTMPYTLGGAALLMISALMYGFRMRKRGVSC
jgi:LPXTG-motif cell wall-anchored protein